MNRTSDTKFIFLDLVARIAVQSYNLHLENGKSGSFVPEQLLHNITVELYDLQSGPPETVNLAG